MSSHHLKYLKKVLVILAIFGIYLIIQMPANAQQKIITREQLDEMSIEEVETLKDIYIDHREQVWNYCTTRSRINQTVCNVQYIRYSQLIESLELYIEQRTVFGE